MLNQTERLDTKIINSHNCFRITACGEYLKTGDFGRNRRKTSDETAKTAQFTQEKKAFYLH